MRDDRERLLDIKEAIERIEKYAARGRETFDNDELIQTWVLITSKSLARLSERSLPISSSSTLMSHGNRSPE